MIEVVITFSANDRPGIIEAIANEVAELNGNWQQSRLIRLGGKFSGLIQVQIAEQSLEQLTSDLNQLDQVEISIERADQINSELEQLDFSIFAHDRPGIVRELSALLAKMGVNVLELNTDCESGAMSGEVVFAADLLVELPTGVDAEDVRTALEGLSDDVVVEFD